MITGLGATGADLCRAGVDKIAFTGSGPTARKVMAVCAETLTPLVAECGGKDAMLVAEDADLDKAVEFAAFGAFGNAGQTCAGVERIYVAEPVYRQFLDKFTAAVERVRPGGSDADTYGPMTLPRQVDVVRNHIADALEKGARAVTGGIDSVHERFVEPVILTDVRNRRRRCARRRSVRPSWSTGCATSRRASSARTPPRTASEHPSSRRTAVAAGT